jgi:hypothetical protein
VALSILPSLFRFWRSPREDEIGVERMDSPSPAEVTIH